jgi:hypothetical protein
MMAMSLLAGRYELRARIGVGGYGEVWRGVDTVLARPVAIKLLQAEHTVQPEARMRFRSEARHAGALSHPCIAHVYDYCEPDPPDPPFLVMELVDGMSLAELLARGPLDVARAMDFLGQAAAGLHAAHQAGLVHRDIKPGNLLVSRNGPVKITDFGIAQAQVPPVSGPVTMIGMVLGTAGYMSPERAEGSQATVASDLYALGVVAHECLAGLLPRGGAALGGGGATAGQPAIIVPLTAPLPPLPAAIPPDVAALVSRLTARDPARRPATAGEVARLAAGLRDRYRGVAPGPDALGRPARGAAPEDTARDAITRPGTVRELTMRDDAVHGPPAGPVPATGPQTRPDGRPSGRGGRRAPSRTVLAIVAAALTGLALLAVGVILVVHLRGPAVAAISPARRMVDVRDSSFVGRPLGAVRRQLRHDGLRIRVTWQDSAGPPGEVLRVQPDGRVPAGSMITVVASRAAGASASPPPPSGQLPPPARSSSASIKPTRSPSPSVSPSPSPSPSGSSSPPAAPSSGPPSSTAPPPPTGGSSAPAPSS